MPNNNDDDNKRGWGRQPRKPSALDASSTDRMLAVVPIEVRDALTGETLDGFPKALYGGALVAGEMLKTSDGLREYEVIRVEQRLDCVVLFVVLSGDVSRPSSP